MIDTSNFGPKDAKILRENPKLVEDKDFYTLTTLGLTAKALERLESGDFKVLPDDQETDNKESVKETKATAPLGVIPETKQVEHTNVAQPSSVRKVEPNKSRVQHTDPKHFKAKVSAPKAGGVDVLNITTGRIIKMSHHAAARLVTKQPKVYQYA